MFSLSMAKSKKSELIQFKVTDSDYSKFTSSNKKRNLFNFALLILLYMLQSMPNGIGIALSLIFQSKKDVTFTD